MQVLCGGALCVHLIYKKFCRQSWQTLSFTLLILHEHFFSGRDSEQGDLLGTATVTSIMVNTIILLRILVVRAPKTASPIPFFLKKTHKQDAIKRVLHFCSYDACILFSQRVCTRKIEKKKFILRCLRVQSIQSLCECVGVTENF